MESCNNKQSDNTFHFTLMNSDHTNISFNNQVTESDSLNVFTNEYMYNGSGVGIGDFNNDGLADIFFGGSTVTSRLYINKGDFKFEDITESAGVQTNQWCTGVSVVDINDDGFLDIYICSSHSPESDKRKNLLFINDGKLRFTEQAAAYGLADEGFATQAAFFDFDKDSDLDMYLLNHRLFNAATNNLVGRDTTGNSPAADKLYRNDGNIAGGNHPVFSDISKQVGIKEDGYGLGLMITDVNKDNWPDIYVANDYISNDVLWLNNGKGNFTNTIASSIRHQSYNSMGVDAADINNDGLPEIAVVDMLPEGNERKKMMFSASSQEKYDLSIRNGHEPSFVRNVLQLHNGMRQTQNGMEPFYSEIGQLSGISETDWSWSILMADFDNDGWKDIHITNGLGRDLTNNDYATFKNSQIQTSYTFAGGSNASALDKNTVNLLRENLDQYGSIKIDNYFFHNNGDLTFSNQTSQTGLNVPSVSNGAAYADLDNDGDLDLVVNNMDQEAFIWKNESGGMKNAGNFLALELKGPVGNKFGIGSGIHLYNKGSVHYLEQSPVRGFCSSVDYRLFFGLGTNAEIDSIKIQWPDNKTQVLKKVKSNQFVSINYADAQINLFEKPLPYQPTLFSEVTGQMAIDYQHVENDFFDFNSRRPLPQKFSQLGPGIATGDMNGDGLMDFFAGGGSNQSGKLFFQNADGSYTGKALVEGIKYEEDLGSVLFDADGDKDLDLMICGGSSEFHTISLNQPRLYLNDGKQNFSHAIDALPPITDITSVIKVSDYDSDGDQDVFIGGRLLPLKYPQSPRSYVLQNNKGKFKDVTKQVCPQLEFAGLITGAVFTDYNSDSHMDLLICGEWMPVRFFANKNGKFIEETDNTSLESMYGQWRSIEAADLDGDGDKDIIAGNIGLNNRFNVDSKRPLKMYAGDFDGNQYMDLIPAYYMKNKKGSYDLFPALDRTQLADQIPIIKKKYLLSADYANANMNDILKVMNAKDMMEMHCERIASIWIENLGNGKFRSHRLPLEAQLAPVNCIIAQDMDNDGTMDLLLAGNEYGTEFSIGRYDASYGLFLKGIGKGDFKSIPPVQSGFLTDGDVRSMNVITKGNEKIILVGINNDKLKCYGVKSFNAVAKNKNGKALKHSNL